MTIMINYINNTINNVLDWVVDKIFPLETFVMNYDDEDI